MASGIDLKMKVSGANKVQRELKQTGKAARGMGAGVRSAGGAMGSMAAAINPVTAALAIATAGLVAAAIAAKLTKDAFIGTIKATLKLADDLDELTKKAQSLGSSNTDLQLMINSMALFGLETGATIKSVQKFQIKIGEAMLPDAPKMLTDAFDRMGVSAEELAKMPMRERFIATANALSGYGDRFTMAADAQQIFGRGSKEMLAVFSRGGDAISEAMDDVERYGLASDQAFKNAENLVDSQLRLKLAFEGLKTDALEPLMPVLEGVVQGLADILAGLDPTKVDEFGDSLADMGEMAVHTLVAVGPMLEMVGKTFRLFAGAAALIGISGLKDLEFITGGLVDMEGSETRWGEWGDGLLGAIRTARGVAETPPIRNVWGLIDDGKGKPRRPTGGGTTPPKAAKVTDPLAQLKRDLEALRRSLLDKEQVLREAKDREIQLTKDGIAAGLLTRRDGKIQELAIQAAFDDEMMAMARAQADALDALNAKAAEKEEARLQIQRNQAIQILTGVGDFAGAMSSIITTLSDENNEEAKKAAKVFFGIQQASSLAVAIIKMAEAIGVANALPFPGNIPAMVTAGVIGGAQIATIAATTIQGLAHAGLPPGALAGSGSNEATIMMRRDEMILDPVGTKAISQMLSQRTQGGQPIQVNTTLEIDGDVLGRTVDTHLVRSSERGLSYQNSIRY